MAKILVVDDQECIRELLSGELSSEGYSVVTAGDAESVWGHIRLSQPDLVLLDLYLDGPEGIKLLGYIKTRKRDMPVIIYSAYDTYRDDSRLAEAAGYVVKSIDFGVLKDTIRNVLAERKMSALAGKADPRLLQCRIAHAH